MKRARETLIANEICIFGLFLRALLLSIICCSRPIAGVPQHHQAEPVDDVTGAELRVAQTAQLLPRPGSGCSRHVQAQPVRYPHPGRQPGGQRHPVQTEAPQTLHQRQQRKGLPVLAQRFLTLSLFLPCFVYA